MKFKQWLEDTTSMSADASLPDPIDNGLSRKQAMKLSVPNSEKADKLFGKSRRGDKVTSLKRMRKIESVS